MRGREVDAGSDGAVLYAHKEPSTQQRGWWPNYYSCQQILDVIFQVLLFRDWQIEKPTAEWCCTRKGSIAHWMNGRLETTHMTISVEWNYVLQGPVYDCLVEESYSTSDAWKRESNTWKRIYSKWSPWRSKETDRWLSVKLRSTPWCTSLTLLCLLLLVDGFYKNSCV